MKQIIQRQRMPSAWLSVILLVTTFWFTACQPVRTSPEAGGDLFSTAPALYLPAPTATINPDAPILDSENEQFSSENPIITLWINETSVAHQTAVNRLIADFSTSHNIHVETILIPSDQMPALMDQAIISGTLPDLILHPVEYAMGWQKKGILDENAAAAVINGLGIETFDPAALEMVSAANQFAAIPFSATPQLLIYRQDWFTEANLPIPNNYDALIDAASILNKRNDLTSGIVVPTDAKLGATQKVFEHLATANGCQLIKNDGEVTLMHPDCLNSLDYYRLLINEYSPVGIQTEISTLNAYLSGRTGMIIAPSSVLRTLAGLDPQYLPTCAECTTAGYLAANSGFIHQISGSGPNAIPSGFSDMTVLGITRWGDQDSAATFATYWLENSYLDWIKVEPERKLPLRRGTQSAPLIFQESWPDLPLNETTSLRDLYPESFLQALAADTANTNRWGFRQGQGAVMSRLYEKLTLPFLLQEMLSGYFTSSQALVESYDRVVALIPNYAYHSNSDN